MTYAERWLRDSRAGYPVRGRPFGDGWVMEFSDGNQAMSDVEFNEMALEVERLK